MSDLLRDTDAGHVAKAHTACPVPNFTATALLAHPTVSPLNPQQSPGWAAGPCHYLPSQPHSAS